MWCDIELLTVDGYDMQFGTNVLGHFFFTQLLLPALAEGAKSAPDGYARVVNTSSSGTYLSHGLNFATFVASPERVKLGTKQLYAQSKLVRRAPSWSEQG